MVVCVALCGSSRRVASSTSGVLFGWNCENSGGFDFGSEFLLYAAKEPGIHYASRSSYSPPLMRTDPKSLE